MKSKLGLTFALIYVLVAVYLIGTQGLFGESFIAIILGMPWSLIPSYFEFGGGSTLVITALLIIPMILNAFILYFIGSLLGRIFSRS